MYGFGDSGLHMLGGGGIVMILFWLGVIALVIWAVKQLIPGERSPQQTNAPSALEIVKARYARGGVSREEYLALLADLQLNEAQPVQKAKRSEF